MYVYNLFRMCGVFKAMASFVGTRNLLQCRSFHQKNQKKYGGKKSILRKGLKPGEKAEYDQFFADQREHLETLYKIQFTNK